MPNDQEYFKSLISLLESDKQQMMLLVGFEIGLPVLTLKDLSFGKVVFDSGQTAPPELRLWLGVSIAFFLIAALCHTAYMRRVHLNTFAVARLMLETGVGQDARTLLFDESKGLWARHGGKYRLGMLALSLALFAYGGFVWTHLSGLEG